jgi:hypothetical protein
MYRGQTCSHRSFCPSITHFFLKFEVDRVKVLEIPDFAYHNLRQDGTSHSSESGLQVHEVATFTGQKVRKRA